MTAPKGTPKDIVDRLHRKVAKAVADLEVTERNNALDVVPDGDTPDELLALTREQLIRYAKVIRDNGIMGE